MYGAGPGAAQSAGSATLRQHLRRQHTKRLRPTKRHLQKQHSHPRPSQQQHRRTATSFKSKTTKAFYAIAPIAATALYQQTTEEQHTEEHQSPRQHKKATTT